MYTTSAEENMKHGGQINLPSVFTCTWEQREAKKPNRNLMVLLIAGCIILHERVKRQLIRRLWERTTGGDA